ncbi:MAG: NUDIX hydrolase [Methylococcaceae bacterium]|nr:NUDIX hydrolase [Methylococcaceae bacterium]MCI0668623.1 NUDIX hydrolase [Methylococcaceae bacterium]MCI0733284.1 NUDIX hydrolase [Methylococcaceae bacterium]
MMIDSESSPPRIGVGAVVFDSGGKLLLIKRDTPPARGRWSIPGGKQEAGETLVNACCREVFEETGLAITLGPIVAVVERRQGCFHYVIIDFLANINPGGPLIPRPAGDVSDARWVGLDELSGYDLVEGLAEVVHISRTMRLDGSTGGLTETNRSQSDFLARPCPAH